MPNPSNPIFQIKVTLDNTHPPVWRRIQVPGHTSLLKLHDILQIVMGWEDYHLHMFTIEGSIYGDPVDDEYGDLDTIDEANFKLNQVIHREGQRLSYEYDFGDSWDHTLLLEKILPPQEGVRYPFCLKGKRACPPEDVGGVWGYKNFLEAIRNPDHDEHEEYMTWIGGDFDPETFDLQEVNNCLRSMGRGRSTEAKNPWAMYEDELMGMKFNLDSPWPKTLPKEQQLIAEELPLRRDEVKLITYLRDNKVTGTQSTGNFPLKVVHEICAQFVEPPQLEDKIGEHTFHVHSESEVWPLHFRHILAAVGGLITGGPGRRWKLTLLGERFLAEQSSWQVWFLLGTWWTQTNWAVASPYGFEAGSMPSGFSQLALKHLLEHPSGDLASFERFADRMIEDSRMVWPIQNQVLAREILHGIIESTVINPLVNFGILHTTYEPHQTLGAEFHELSAFRVTPFGYGLLEAIHDALKPDQ
jgi:hypothetical protein